MRTTHLLIGLLGLLGLFATACGGPVVQETTPVAVQPEPEPEPEPEPVPEHVHIEGDHLTIDRTINFANNSDTILDDSSDLLDQIALILSQNPDELEHLQVIGHTDALGDDASNLDLSSRRAAAVVAALQTRGVTIMLDHTGVGEQEPLCEETTPECNARNRRVEFLIVHDHGE